MDFEKVKEIIVETLSCDADKVTPEATLAEDLEADSLSAVELSMALEEAFGISIADEDLPNLKTVGDLYQYLQDHADEAEKAEYAASLYTQDAGPFRALASWEMPHHCFCVERSRYDQSGNHGADGAL